MNEVCADLLKLGIDARTLKEDPQSPGCAEAAERSREGEWIEIPDGPIRRFNLNNGHPHWLVPDTRLGSDLNPGFAEVYAVVVRRFPVFGRIKGVEWHWSEPQTLEPEGERFYNLVSDVLEQDPAVTEGVLKIGWHVEVYPDHERWLICCRSPGIDAPTWGWLQAIAGCLLDMDIAASE